MSRTHSNRRSKPQKPSPDFPLFPHATGKWAKKINGKLYYFGSWDNPQGALEAYEQVKHARESGRAPEAAHGRITLKDVINLFLNNKRMKMEAGEMSRRAHDDYKGTCNRLVEHFGRLTPLMSILPEDWVAYRADIAKRRGPVALGNEVQRIRTLGKWAFESQLIDRPVPFGPDFKRPNKTVIRRHTQARPAKLFTAAEVLALADEVGIHLRAMVMLGINCGYGNSDVGNLPLSAVDLESGWIVFPRPKTAVERRCPLWPETIQALGASLARRPAPKVPEAEKLFFVTPYGMSWHKEVAENPLSKSINAALMRLRIHRAGLGFYTLRHTFATISSQATDQVATNYVMGHADPHIAETYRHDVWEPRLRRVVEHVRTWLYAGALDGLVGAGIPQ